MSARAGAAAEAWAAEAWERIEPKLAATRRRIGAGFPFVSIGGRYREKEGDESLSWWTNGFWPGLCWLAFRETGDEAWRETARACEARLDLALERFEGLHHDVGFVWNLASAASYRLTGEPGSRRRALHAATLLAGRFNLAGRFIRAWNGDKAGWAIVDTLMNLPLLYWASEETGDPRFGQVARAHADTALTRILRPDGSASHVARFDPATGIFLENLAGQGYAPASSWSRGQAWALYGFSLSYRHAREARYLEAAERAAGYFLGALAEEPIPPVDFRAPKLAMNWDSSAGAIAAAGLLELGRWAEPARAERYASAGARLLKSLDALCGAWSLPEEEGLLLHGRHAWRHEDPASPNDTPIIYGDYFFAEAVLGLKSGAEPLW